MFRRALHINLENENGNTIDVALRLTAGSYISLQNKYKQPILQIVLQAVDDTQMACDVLKEALNFKDNENVIKDGGVMYDALVDNGYSGNIAFAELFINLARESGLLSDENATALIEFAHNADNNGAELVTKNQ